MIIFKLLTLAVKFALEKFYLRLRQGPNEEELGSKRKQEAMPLSIFRPLPSNSKPIKKCKQNN